MKRGNCSPLLHPKKLDIATLRLLLRRLGGQTCMAWWDKMNFKHLDRMDPSAAFRGSG